MRKCNFFKKLLLNYQRRSVIWDLPPSPAFVFQGTSVTAVSEPKMPTWDLHYKWHIQREIFLSFGWSSISKIFFSLFLSYFSDCIEVNWKEKLESGKKSGMQRNFFCLPPSLISVELFIIWGLLSSSEIHFSLHLMPSRAVSIPNKVKIQSTQERLPTSVLSTPVQPSALLNRAPEQRLHHIYSLYPLYLEPAVNPAMLMASASPTPYSELFPKAQTIRAIGGHVTETHTEHVLLFPRKSHAVFTAWAAVSRVLLQ